MEKTSGLPPLEQIREEQTMRIITIDTHHIKRKQVETTLTVGKDRRPLIASIMTIDDERVKGFMPSKIWPADLPHTKWSSSDLSAFNLLYYVNSIMPEAAKPFKEHTYLMYFHYDKEEVIEYDINTKMFMDQVQVPPFGTMFVVMFGNEVYNDIVVKELK